MRQLLLALGVGAAMISTIGLSGCKSDDDNRSTDEKLNQERPNFNSRYIMTCPKCGAPQRPYRVTTVKSYYRCTGIPPKFPWHEEENWVHDIDRKDTSER